MGYPLQYSWASLAAQMVMNLPAMQETQVQSLRWEYPLEKVIATHSSILSWRSTRDTDLTPLPLTFQGPTLWIIFILKTMLGIPWQSSR